MLSFYILFLIPSFLIHSHKLFSMQLGPSTASLACARLIVSFVPFNTVKLELPSIVRIHPVVNVSRIRYYVGQVKGQKKEQLAPVIIEGEEK